MLSGRRKMLRMPKPWRMTFARKRSTMPKGNGTTTNKRRTMLNLEPKTSREKKLRWN